MNALTLRLTVCLLVAAAWTYPLSAAAQADPSPPPKQDARLDAAAVAALDRMSKALRALPHFSLTSDASTEVVLDSGQKIELDGLIRYEVQPPRHLFLEIKNDRVQRQLFYDGSTLTLYSPRLKYYASVDGVHPTLGELAATLSDDYGIDLPLVDLFLWGTDDETRHALTSAIYVGAATLDGERVDQYAYQQPGVDWQLWIGQSTFLPRKIVITSLDDPALPKYTARLTWDTTSAIAAGRYTFKPPPGSARITLVNAGAVAAQSEEK